MRWVCSKKIILFTRGCVGKLGVCPKLFCLSSFNIRFAYKVLTSSFVAWINGRRRSLAMAIRARVCSLLVAFPKVPLTFTFTYFSSLAMAIHARVWSTHTRSKSSFNFHCLHPPSKFYFHFHLFFQFGNGHCWGTSLLFTHTSFLWLSLSTFTFDFHFLKFPVWQWPFGHESTLYAYVFPKVPLTFTL